MICTHVNANHIDTSLLKMYHGVVTDECKLRICLGLIFVVDSSDRARMEEAKQELFGIVKSDQMRGVPVVVIANKQDMPGYHTISQICILKAPKST